ncbi:DUF692 family multinuclear iron-containing protein [Virgibacillus kekensis]|uniref:DUF692 family multinuclear iron-containing protein n=1 Tax=Virgibacillus kekensis TaxID=202261 RepID=A0ABV9DM76_9BACI
MKLAVNYSPAAEQLVRERKINIDIFKCPDFSRDLIDQAESVKPNYIHFGLNAGRGQMDKVDWNTINELRSRTNTPYVNVHAVAFTKDYPDVDVFTKKPEDTERIVKAVVHDINMVAEQVGMENIILENVICRGEGENMLQPIIDPAALTEIVNQTGCGFLLDTAHARMTSMLLGLDVRKYISSLPLESIKELHITGIQADEKGRLRDSMPMTSEDWDIAAWVVQQIKDGTIPKPWVTALEYGGVGPKFEWRTDKEVLAEQVPMLSDLIAEEAQN